MNTRIRENLREYKLNSVYFRLFTLFICLIFIPSILIGTFIYLEASKKFQVEINKHNLYTLEYIEDEIENITNNVSALAMQYVLDGEVRYFSLESFESNRLSLERLFKKINNTKVTYSYIDSIYVYYKSNQQMVTTDGVYAFKDFYDQDWANRGQSLKDKSGFLPTRKVYQKMEELTINRDVLTYVSYFPVSGSEKTGAIVININVQEIIAKLNQIKKDPESNLFIIDNNGTILLSNKVDYLYRNFTDMAGSKYNRIDNGRVFVGQFNDHQMLFTISAENKMNWKFIELTPFETVKSNTAFIKNTVLLFLGIMALLLLAAVYLITNKIYNPLTYLMDIVKISTGVPKHLHDRTSSAKNEMDLLKERLMDISNTMDEERKQNQLFRAHMSHKVLAKNLFMNLVLCSGEETSWIIQRLKVLEWPQDNYIVLLLSIDDYLSFLNTWDRKDQALWKYCLTNIAEEIINRDFKGILFEDSLQQWVAVINLPECSEQDAYREMEKLGDEIRQAINGHMSAFTITISVGSFCSELSLLPDSYKNARKAMQTKWVRGKNRILQYCDMGIPPKNTFYNMELERQIIFSLKKNDLEGAEKTLESFIKELVAKNNSTYADVYQGVLQLLMSVIRMLNEMGFDLREVFRGIYSTTGYNILDDFNTIETIKDVEKWIKLRFKDISDYFWDQRSDRKEEDITSILEYIHENFDKEISLAIVAEEFGYSEHSLSKLIKRCIGENFLEYLTKLRIERAKKLIAGFEFSIQDVSQMVGYMNVQNFIRVFKKLEGITPGQYKETVKK